MKIKDEEKRCITTGTYLVNTDFQSLATKRRITVFFLPDIHDTKLDTVALSNASRCSIVAEVAGEKYVPRDFLNLLVVGEGGKIGSKVKNTNDSYDLGPAQVNTIHSKYILRNYPNKSWVDVATDPVLNIRISADIFKGCLTYAKGHVWEAVGCYNSKTVNIKTNYLIRTMKTWDYILKRPSLNCSEYWYQD
jgi:hypothetical protein